MNNMAVLQFSIIIFFTNILPGLAIVFFLTRNRKDAGLVDKVILGVLVSPLVLVILSFLEEITGIPQDTRTLTINVIVLAVVNIAYLTRYHARKEDYALRFTWVKGLAYALFAALFLFRVLPTLDILVPLAHDPIAHSQWLEYLNIHNFTTVDQWYPQGLEYFFNYYATFLDIGYPKLILVATNAALALFPVSMFYLGLFTVKGGNRWLIFPFIMFVLSARIRLPNEFYLTSGKNSMVLAFSLTPFLLYLAAANKNRWEYIAATILSYGVVLIHYPTGFLLLFVLFFISLRDVVRLTDRKPDIDPTQLVHYLTAIAIFAGLSGLLLIRILPIYANSPLTEDISFDYVIDYINLYGLPNYIWRNFLEDQLQAYRMTVFVLFIGAVSAFLLVRDDNREFTGKMLAASASLFLIGIPVLFLDEQLGVRYHVQFRFFMVFTVVTTVSWFIYYVYQRMFQDSRREGIISVAAVVLLGAAFLYGGSNQYQKYMDYQNDLNTVRDADIEAFEFINQNVEGDMKILVRMGRPYIDKGPVVGADSGSWIPSFTDKEVEVSFLDFASGRSMKIFDLYTAVAEDSNDIDAISELYCDYEVGYIFFGSRAVYFDNMSREDLQGSRYIAKLFDNGAAVYEISGMNCGTE